MVMPQLGIQTMTDSAATLRLVRWAEDAGLDAFAVADHYLSGPDNGYALDQLTLLGAVAQVSDTIELATLVSPVTFRHPAVLLKSAVTLDELSGGRFTLGIGTGWMAEEHELFGLDFPPLGERFELTEEALGYVRAGIDGTAFGGSHFRLGDSPQPKPTGSHLRLVVGGSGPKRTPRLAGRYANEFNASPHRDGFATRIARARKAAAEAGRDPERLLISTAFPLVTGTESDVSNYLERLAAARQIEVDELRGRWAEAGIPIGRPDQIRDSLASLGDEGIDRVYFQVGRMDPDLACEAVESVLG